MISFTSDTLILFPFRKAPFPFSEVKISPRKGAFIIPNTENGGSWESFNPKIQLHKFFESNNETNGLTVILSRIVKKFTKRSKSKLDDIIVDMIEEPISGAIGTFVASRVSPGTGDHLIFEIRGTRGSIIFSTSQPDIYESYLPGEGWRRHEINSDYLPLTKYPSGYTPSGWLRALVHNHYLFLGGNSDGSVIPDLSHGIQVQRLILQIARHILSS